MHKSIARQTKGCPSSGVDTLYQSGTPASILPGTWRCSIPVVVGIMFFVANPTLLNSNEPSRFRHCSSSSFSPQSFILHYREHLPAVDYGISTVDSFPFFVYIGTVGRSILRISELTGFWSCRHDDILQYMTSAAVAVPYISCMSKLPLLLLRLAVEIISDGNDETEIKITMPRHLSSWIMASSRAAQALT